MNLSGSHVLLTGATRGIGRQLAPELAARGARLTLVARDASKLGGLAAELSAHVVSVDLCDEAALERVLPEAETANGPVDVLINNAGVLIPGPLARASAAQLRAMVLTNVLAPLELSRRALPGMVERGRGAVVNMSSLAGEMALRNMATYVGTKAALSLSTRAVQRELRGTGVHALLVILGSVETEMTLVDSNRDPVTAATNRRFSRLAPLPVERVTGPILDAVERGRRVLVMPGYGRGMPPMRMLPTRVADALLVGVQRSL